MSIEPLDMSRHEREIVDRFSHMISHENAVRYGLFDLPTFKPLNKVYSYFITDTENIASLGLNELDGHCYYTTSYPKKDATLPKKVVLVARKNKEDGIYLHLLGDNRKILVAMEDFYLGEFPVDRKNGLYTPGMVLVSNERERVSKIKGHSLLFDEGMTYQTRRTLEKVKEHPLVIDINNLLSSDYYESFDKQQLRTICKEHLEHFSEISQSIGVLEQESKRHLEEEQEDFIERGLISRPAKKVLKK